MKTIEACKKVDERYFASAPFSAVAEVTVNASAAEAFECLLDAEAWPRWAPAITNVRWTSSEPFGVGTTRTVHMIGGMVADEVFIAWEPNRRMAFYFTRANMPAEAFAEDYVLEEDGQGRTRVRWTMAMTPKGGSKLTMKLFGPILARLNRWMLGRFGKLVEREYAGRSAPARASA